ncbi:aldehyde dehydrogenase (plasmid) [Klebsiella sp. B345]|uniref:aldehyde dehydrogenase n=1 Tax=Klebsiella sp. B345 TaxID=2755398 RepID=UPI003DA8AEFE
MNHINLLIGGTLRAAIDGRTFERRSPWTGEVVTRAAAASLADADAAVSAAADAFNVWSVMGPTARRARLLRAADALEARIPEFIKLGMEEIGATPDWMGFNAAYAANLLRESAALTTRIRGDVIASDLDDALMMTVRAPCGVVLGIAPWNSPVILAVRALATPLACGNTVVLKASEICPATHMLIGQILQESGLGDGVVNILTSTPQDAPALVEHLISTPQIKRINFTGSTKVGRIVARHAAEYLKPSLLELGGKAPLVVLDDADLDAAVSAIAFGAFINQGQVCMSTERVIVAESVADELVKKLTLKTLALKAGGQNTILGMLESSGAAQRIQSLVENARDLGAVLPVGCSVEGACMQPCIVENVTPEMQLYAEESFGPVVTVQRVSSDEEAVRIANDSEYGLTAAVYSQDVSRALRVARQLKSGSCHINGATLHDEPQMPMGGLNASGWGRFGGEAGIQEFTDLRTITLQSGQQIYPV